jgi:hypothetical protein
VPASAIANTLHYQAFKAFHSMRRVTCSRRETGFIQPFRDVVV